MILISIADRREFDRVRINYQAQKSASACKKGTLGKTHGRKKEQDRNSSNGERTSPKRLIRQGAARAPSLFYGQSEREEDPRQKEANVRASNFRPKNMEIGKDKTDKSGPPCPDVKGSMKKERRAREKKPKPVASREKELQNPEKEEGESMGEVLITRAGFGGGS